SPKHSTFYVFSCLTIISMQSPAHRLISILFFFSSRRRHTRWPRDWSSDVCSSDLGFAAGSRTIRPLLLPKNAFVPCGLKTRELGGFGSDAAPETALFDVLIDTIELPQLKFVPHPVLVAHTVVVAFVPVTVAFTMSVG